MAYGKDIASRVPPPNKLKKGTGSGDEEDAADESDPNDEEEDKTVAAGMMKDFLGSIGVKVDDTEASDACDKLEQYLETAGFVRK